MVNLMINIKYNEKCCGCGACVQKCPQKCIDLKKDSEGFSYPEVNDGSCINCGLCDHVCPFNVSIKVNKNEPLESLACYAKDKTIQLNSSSGGVFSLLATLVIERAGVVYGTAMADDCRSASVVSVQSIQNLYRLRGSKYLQSQTKNTFIEIQNYLRQGRHVLFSGTPCQISALKLFLGQEYEHLYCVDIICHGTPSPELWCKYVDYMEKKFHLKLVNVNFRCKDDSWKDFGIKSNYSGRQVYIDRKYDAYMQMFLRNYCLRPSCYVCKAKSYSMSDITLGDFWGIDRVLPKMNNPLGTSLVLLRTQKGRELLQNISDLLVMESVDYSDAVIDNKAEYKSVDRPTERDTFFKDMNRMEFKDFFMKYLYPSPKLKLKKSLIDMGIWKFIEKLRGGAIVNLQYGMLLEMEKRYE